METIETGFSYTGHLGSFQSVRFLPQLSHDLKFRQPRSLAIYLKFIVEDYEEKTSANSPPWFCDERIIVQAPRPIDLVSSAVGE